VNVSEGMTPRVVGGSPVPIHTYPWFARATESNTSSSSDRYWAGCAGNLISAEYVLTAAHCIDSQFEATGGYEIGALWRPYTEASNGGQDVEYLRVDKVTVHPDFNDYSLDSDFAVAKLKGSSRMEPVNIDDGTYSPNYEQNKGNLWAIGKSLYNLI